MVVPCGGPKKSPVHPFNALIFPILRDCLQSVSYLCLAVNLVFSNLGYWSANLFLIAPFPDLCLLVVFFYKCVKIQTFSCIFTQLVQIFRTKE